MANPEIQKEMTERFPSPLGVIFSLIPDYIPNCDFVYVEFPSPLGVIFSLMIKLVLIINKSLIRFRLLSELYSLLLIVFNVYIRRQQKRWFPSPLGVIFSLIKEKINMNDKILEYSFRLLSELYSLLLNLLSFVHVLDIKPVSVSSRSYILSYLYPSDSYRNLEDKSFRLLSELYSLLSIEQKPAINQFGLPVSVSSRSYILSYAPLGKDDYLGGWIVSVSSRSYILSYL